MKKAVRYSLTKKSPELLQDFERLSTDSTPSTILDGPVFITFSED